MTINVIIKVKLSKFVNDDVAAAAAVARGDGQFSTANHVFNGVTCKN